MLKDELGLSGAQLGMLLSSFFWTYGLFQILSGWLVDRFHVGWVMAIGFFCGRRRQLGGLFDGRAVAQRSHGFWQAGGAGNEQAGHDRGHFTRFPQDVPVG